MDNVNENFEAAQISVTTNVCARKGRLGGIFVSAASIVPTITIYDDPANGTGTKLVDTFTPAPGTFYRLPFRFLTGCRVVITGTVSCTVGYQGA